MKTNKIALNKMLLILVLLFTITIIFILAFSSIKDKQSYSEKNYLSQEDSFICKSWKGATDIANLIELEVEGFTGRRTICNLSVKSPEATLLINTIIKEYSGDIKIIIIENNSVITVLPTSSGLSTETINIANGECQIKIVGKNANFKLEAEVEVLTGNAETIE